MRIIRFGDCEVDFDRAELRRAGRAGGVTPQELRLLERVPAESRPRAQPRAADRGGVGPGMAITDRAVDTHVFNLRKKIEPVPSEPQVPGRRARARLSLRRRRLDRLLTDSCRPIDSAATTLPTWRESNDTRTTSDPDSTRGFAAPHACGDRRRRAAAKSRCVRRWRPRR